MTPSASCGASLRICGTDARTAYMCRSASDTFVRIAVSDPRTILEIPFSTLIAPEAPRGAGRAAIDA
eukprot:4482033-Pleurochrysis_carterae.AAC.2